MDVQPTEIPDIKLITPRKFGDARGFFSETYSRQRLREIGIDVEFVQDNHSLSGPAGTVRGLHYQAPPFAQAKLVRVSRGSVLDVAVDIREGSATFGRHVAVELSAKNWRQLYIPPGFAHGYCTLEPDTEVQYKVSTAYAPDSEFGIRWDDPALGIDWRIAGEPTLSDKDKANPLFADAPRHF